MDINLLVKITERAWSLTILSLLDRGVPARQAPLLAASGAGRTAFAQSFAHLQDTGLLERNPGHGHPLRPEFRLTETGRTAAALATRILQASPEIQQPVLRRAWSVPVLGALTLPRHFSDLRARLPQITDRALSQSLTALQGTALISRQVDATARPPRPLYAAINAGRAIAEAVAFRP